MLSMFINNHTKLISYSYCKDVKVRQMQVCLLVSQDQLVHEKPGQPVRRSTMSTCFSWRSFFVKQVPWQHLSSHVQGSHKAGSGVVIPKLKEHPGESSSISGLLSKRFLHFRF